MTTADTAFVLAAHGTRDERGLSQARQLAEMVHAARPEAALELAFLERAEPDLATALDRGTQAAERVTLIPLFLNSGTHLHEDLPAALAAARERHPQRHIAMSDAVGLDPALPDLLVRRLDEVRGSLAGAPLAAVLAAHGSRDPRAGEEVHHLAELLVTRTGLPVYPAFFGMGGPGPGEVLAGLAREGYAGAVVLPHLLFTGLFHDRLIEEAGGAPLPTAVAPPYGPDPALRDAILDRIDG